MSQDRSRAEERKESWPPSYAIRGIDSVDGPPSVAAPSDDPSDAGRGPRPAEIATIGR